MKFVKIGTEMFEELRSLQKDYKVAIGEDVPSEMELESLRKAIEQGHIHFYGCICDETLVACCSICVTYSTFNYDKSGVFEDFYIKENEKPLDNLKENGGYIFASDHSIPNDVSLENMKRIVPFVNQLKKKLPQIPVEMVDERFTSVLAHQAMLDGGLKKKARQDKALVDEISATIILQSYLESKKYQF